MVLKSISFKYIENVKFEIRIPFDCNSRTSKDLNDIKGYLEIQFSFSIVLLMACKEKTIYFYKHKIFLLM